MLHALSENRADQELAYVEFTSNVTVSATVEASADTVVTAAAIPFDGATRIMVEFYTVAAICGTNGTLGIFLFDGSTSQGFIAFCSDIAGTLNSQVLTRRFLTPTAGSHTYSIRAYRVSANGTIVGGAGGAGNNMPGYIRVTRA